MLKNIKSHWKRTVSGLLAVVMAVGMFPVSAFAADSSGGSNPYAPTGNFELNIAGATAWNGGSDPLTVNKTESGGTQVAAIPAAVPFAILEDKGGDRLKIGYVSDGSWTGGSLDGTGWVDKDSVLVNLPDVLPSIAYESDSSKQFNSRLTRFEYVVPGSYALAEQLALLQQEAMSSGETLVVRQSVQRAPARVSASNPTGALGPTTPAAPAGKSPPPPTWPDPQAGRMATIPPCGAPTPSPSPPAIFIRCIRPTTLSCTC